MIKFKIGQTVGDLTIIQQVESSDHGDRQYLCECACGNICIKKATILRYVYDRGFINSCGCRRKNKKL